MLNFLKSKAIDKNFAKGTTQGKDGVSGRGKILDKLIDNYNFKSVLDVGCGYGDFFNYLNEKNIDFEGVGIDVMEAWSEDIPFDYISSTLENFKSDKMFDLIFCSHVIEHAQDTGFFLKKLFSHLRIGGAFCIIWPPPKYNVVGGHVHIFNHGLLLYNLIRSGVDCSSVCMYRSGYNLAIMGEYSIADLPDLTFNRFEIEILKNYFPCPVAHNFDGSLKRYVTPL